MNQPVQLRGRRPQRAGPGVLVVAPFHSTSNPPVGLAYLRSALRSADIEATILDLNIEARRVLWTQGAEPVQDRVRRLFLQSQRSYLGEAMTWSWLDPGGADAMIARLRSDGTREEHELWLERVQLEALADDPVLVAVGARLRAWVYERIEQIVEAGYRWVGLSLTVSNLGCSLYVARVLRSLDPSIALYLGGPHLTPRNATELETLFDATAVFPAPAERDFVARLLGGGAPPSRSGSRGTSIELLPLADWTTTDFRIYDPPFAVLASWSHRTDDYRAIPLQTSRGCSYSKCEYCHNVVDHSTYATLTPARVVAELRHQIDSTECRSFFFTDDEFNGSPGRVRELCRRVVDDLPDIRWFAWIRLDRVSRRQLDAMYEAGCRRVFVGVEAVVDALLQQLTKGYPASVAIDRLALLASFTREHDDFEYTFNMIIHHPCETEADFDATRAVVDARPELFAGNIAAFHEYEVYEGTPADQRFGDGLVGALDHVVPPPLQVSSFRRLLVRPPEFAERDRRWRTLERQLRAG